jgi:hypothetical protein
MAFPDCSDTLMRTTKVILDKKVKLGWLAQGKAGGSFHWSNTLGSRDVLFVLLTFIPIASELHFFDFFYFQQGLNRLL